MPRNLQGLSLMENEPLEFVGFFHFLPALPVAGSIGGREGQRQRKKKQSMSVSHEMRAGRLEDAKIPSHLSTILSWGCQPAGHLSTPATPSVSVTQG